MADKPEEVTFAQVRDRVEASDAGLLPAPGGTCEMEPVAVRRKACGTEDRRMRFPGDVSAFGPGGRASSPGRISVVGSFPRIRMPIFFCDMKFGCPRSMAGPDMITIPCSYARPGRSRGSTRARTAAGTSRATGRIRLRKLNETELPTVPCRIRSCRASGLSRPPAPNQAPGFRRGPRGSR